MHLAVLVDGHHAHNCADRSVPGEQHRAGMDSPWVWRICEHGPAETVIVLSVEVGYEIEVFHLALVQRE